MNEIDDIADRYIDAVYRKDAAALLALYAEDVFVFDMWDRWSYHGREEWAGAVKAWFGSLGSDRVGVRLTPALVRVDGDAAVWCATVRYAGLNEAGAELRSMENRMPWSLRRTGGAWRIVHEHSSAPADFATMKVRLSSGDV